MSVVEAGPAGRQRSARRSVPAGLTMRELVMAIAAMFRAVGCDLVAGAVVVSSPVVVKASYLLGASVMADPCSLALSKLTFPETERNVIDADEVFKIAAGSANNVIEAASSGASTAIKLVASVAVNVMAFLAILEFLNATLIWLGDRAGVDGLSFQFLCSYLFYPITFLMGVDPQDCHRVAQLIGYKVFSNEFVAYMELGHLLENRDVLTNYTSAFGANTSILHDGLDIVLPEWNSTRLPGGVLSSNLDAMPEMHSSAEFLRSRSAGRSRCRKRSGKRKRKGRSATRSRRNLERYGSGKDSDRRSLSGSRRGCRGRQPKRKKQKLQPASYARTQLGNQRLRFYDADDQRADREQRERASCPRPMPQRNKGKSGTTRPQTSKAASSTVTIPRPALSFDDIHPDVSSSGCSSSTPRPRTSAPIPTPSSVAPRVSALKSSASGPRWAGRGRKQGELYMVIGEDPGRSYSQVHRAEFGVCEDYSPLQGREKLCSDTERDVGSIDLNVEEESYSDHHHGYVPLPGPSRKVKDDSLDLRARRSVGTPVSYYEEEDDSDESEEEEEEDTEDGESGSETGGTTARSVPTKETATTNARAWHTSSSSKKSKASSKASSEQFSYATEQEKTAAHARALVENRSTEDERADDEAEHDEQSRAERNLHSYKENEEYVNKDKGQMLDCSGFNSIIATSTPRRQTDRGDVLQIPVREAQAAGELNDSRQDDDMQIPLDQTTRDQYQTSVEQLANSFDNDGDQTHRGTQTETPFLLLTSAETLVPSDVPASEKKNKRHSGHDSKRALELEGMDIERGEDEELDIDTARGKLPDDSPVVPKIERGDEGILRKAKPLSRAPSGRKNGNYRFYMEDDRGLEREYFLADPSAQETYFTSSDAPTDDSISDIDSRPSTRPSSAYSQSSQASKASGKSVTSNKTTPSRKSVPSVKSVISRKSAASAKVPSCPKPEATEKSFSQKSATSVKSSSSQKSHHSHKTALSEKSISSDNKVPSEKATCSEKDKDSTTKSRKRSSLVRSKGSKKSKREAASVRPPPSADSTASDRGEIRPGTTEESNADEVSQAACKVEESTFEGMETETTQGAQDRAHSQEHPNVVLSAHLDVMLVNQEPLLYRPRRPTSASSSRGSLTMQHTSPAGTGYCIAGDNIRGEDDSNRNHRQPVMVHSAAIMKDQNVTFPKLSMQSSSLISQANSELGNAMYSTRSYETNYSSVKQYSADVSESMIHQQERLLEACIAAGHLLYPVSLFTNSQPVDNRLLFPLHTYHEGNLPT
ncbi:hypothetical protein ACOMHN_006087 [Nucella lapillus]